MNVNIAIRHIRVASSQILHESCSCTTGMSRTTSAIFSYVLMFLMSSMSCSAIENITLNQFQTITSIQIIINKILKANSDAYIRYNTNVQNMRSEQIFEYIAIALFSTQFWNWRDDEQIIIIIRTICSQWPKMLTKNETHTNQQQRVWEKKANKSFLHQRIIWMLNKSFANKQINIIVLAKNNWKCKMRKYLLDVCQRERDTWRLELVDSLLLMLAFALDWISIF